MPRDSLVGLIEPMFRSAGASHSRAAHTRLAERPSDDRPQCLENFRPEGAEPTLAESVCSPFHAEPRQQIELESVVAHERDTARAFRARCISFRVFTSPFQPNSPAVGSHHRCQIRKLHHYVFLWP